MEIMLRMVVRPRLPRVAGRKQRYARTCGRSSLARARPRADGQTHRRITRGRVRAEPSLQLGTQSKRIANPLCIIHSALSRLSCRAYARRTYSGLAALYCRAYARRPCCARHTQSGLAALCRTRTDTRRAINRHDLPTSQPDNQQPFCQYPAVSWELNARWGGCTLYYQYTSVARWCHHLVGKGIRLMLGASPKSPFILKSISY